MGIIIIRFFFAILVVITGYFVSPPNMAVVGGLVGLAGAAAVILLETVLQNIPVRRILFGALGLIVGLVSVKLLVDFIFLIPAADENQLYVRIFLYYLFSYLGITIAVRYGGKWSLLSGMMREEERVVPLLLDSNVIIDGRLLDLAHTGFLDYRLVVPRFVISELQTIADAGNDLKRQRGRRGLDMLNRMRRDTELDIQIEDVDFPEIVGVDAKLVHLAKTTGAKILTNDYNLAKIAEVQNIGVLNMNNLSTVLKPRYLPGEHLLLKVVREGKEPNQGVGYLDDGTMVVVESGHRFMGDTVEVVIANTIQTSTGRMLFAELT